MTLEPRLGADQSITALAAAEILRAGADANLSASCRIGSIDLIRAPGRLIATGDVHDNPVSLSRLIAEAGLDQDSPNDPSHLVLHELIHSPTLSPDGLDWSHRALIRVAQLKAAHPEHVHVLLANHELAQATGSDIRKNGVRLVEAFDRGLKKAFGRQTEKVRDAIRAFVRSMPIALRCQCPSGDVLCAHSLPGPGMMGRFDPSILSRPMRPSDYDFGGGSAYAMVWGRGYDHEQLEDLTERWGVNLFILGHEHAPNGYALIEPNAIVLNSDHDRGVFLPVDLSDVPRLSECPGMVVPLLPQ
ncbi:MAG: metallophosphoesterase [Phycisphaerales bacterium]